nr:keratin-associated protein 5-5-like [Cherax quadricarinatus]
MMMMMMMMMMMIMNEDNDNDNNFPKKNKKHQDDHTRLKAPKKTKGCRLLSKCKKERGACKKSCERGEKEVRKGCKGKGCRCCSTGDNSEKGSCKPVKKCKKRGGTCKSSCSGQESDAGTGCQGGCRCCLPAADCTSTNKCRTLGGTCKARCTFTEQMVPDHCGGGCFCCVAEMKGCPNTPACLGRCSQSCPGLVSNIPCLGSTCTCCLDCQITPACQMRNGACKEKCSCEEEELPGGCTGKGCKCCVAHTVQCSAESQCSGQCVFRPLCTGALNTTTACAGDTGCSCCTA